MHDRPSGTADAEICSEGGRRGTEVRAQRVPRAALQGGVEEGRQQNVSVHQRTQAPI